MYTAEIISTGSEIMQGLYADTNAQQLSRRLTTMGLQVMAHHAVGDEKSGMRAILESAARRADLVITTGGLGPTVDDLTREVVAEICGKELVPDRRAEEEITQRYEKRGIPMSLTALTQASIPQNAIPLHNRNGTAMGFIVRGESGRAAVIALPGPPREWHPMFEETVVAFVREFFPSPGGLFTRVIRTFNLPESVINGTLKDLFHSHESVDITLLAKPRKVDVRIIIKGMNSKEASALATQFSEEIIQRIDREHVYGYDETTLEESVAQLLAQHNLTIAAAESCTGGLVSMRLTEVAGSSSYFLESFVTYSNDAKMKRLGVEVETLERHGAVSEDTAREMAAGVREITGADIGLSITGIAGPTGGTPEKPVGLVLFGLSAGDVLEVTRATFSGSRQENRLWSSDMALDLVRRYILRASKK